jgi:FAD/FMN-containing dehydrogenase/Fe-S oxidoreductase
MKVALNSFKKQFKGDIYFDALHKKMYATDASVYRMIPLAVAFPKNESDIKQLIAFATKYKISLIPRAAGTSLAGQCVGNGIVVDTSKYFTKIISVNQEEKTVTVQPGVIRDELNAFLKPFGLFFGPNTSTSNRCMIGGMVGNNSSGTTSIKYGVTRDKVVKLDCILSNGDTVSFSELSEKAFVKKTKLDTLEGKIYKNIAGLLSNQENRNEIINQFPKPEIHRRNTGYAVDALLNFTYFGGNENTINLSKLLCGSEGTLAFTTAITLKLDTLPPSYNALLAVHYTSLKNCLLDVNTVMKHNLYMCEMMDDVILNCTKKNKKYNSYRFFVSGNPKAMLFLEVKAQSVLQLETQVKALKKSLENSGLSYACPVLYNDDVEKAIQLRKAGLGLLGNMVGDKKAVACIEDTAVTLSDLPNYIAAFSEIMKKYNQQAVYYAHAGAGELHLRPILNLKKREDVILFRKITTDVAALVKKYRGSFSGEHGDGIVRSEFLVNLIGNKNYALLKEIKNTFDPLHIFNAGKIIDSFKMDESLRYQPDAPVTEIKTAFDFSDTQGILRMAENCNGSGDCRKPATLGDLMCPSYQATKNEKDSTRARANVLREVLTNNTQVNKFNDKELKEVLDLCLSCKGCATECPSNVDIATIKSEFLYQYQKNNRTSLGTKFIANSSYYNALASKLPWVSNFIFSNAITSFGLKKLFGFSLKRSLPTFSTNALHIPKDLETVKDKKKPKVYLFIDEFSKYFDASIANDAMFLLNKLGYAVTCVKNLDSARALLSKGFLDQAKKQIDKNIKTLFPKLTNDSVLLGLEPSAILGFRDEYLRLASEREKAKHIAKLTFLIEEFIASEIKKGAITSGLFTQEKASLKIHIHCHQKALGNQKDTFDVLNLPVNYTPVLIPSGCCGMAGSFGLEKEHYEISMQIGNLKLFPAINKAKKDVILVANGHSCRHQIKDGTQRKALHPISVLKNALL